MLIAASKKSYTDIFADSLSYTLGTSFSCYPDRPVLSVINLPISVCRKKNGEFITKEHSRSSLDGKLQSSTDLVECFLKLGNAEIVEPQNQILVEKSSEEPD